MNLEVGHALLAAYLAKQGRLGPGAFASLQSWNVRPVPGGGT